MKMSFRWYGPDDPVTLTQIRQIPGMQNIVTAVYDVPPGEIWSEQSIAGLRAQIHEAGLAFEVVESVPVPEAIKLGSQEAGRCIENYCENIPPAGPGGGQVRVLQFYARIRLAAQRNGPSAARRRARAGL